MQKKTLFIPCIVFKSSLSLYQTLTTKQNNKTMTFKINTSYTGAGYYGDCTITILSKTEKTVLAKTNFGEKRMKLRKDKNGEFIFWKAWMFRPSDKN